MYLPARVGNRSSIADFFPDGKSRIFSAALRAAPILIYMNNSNVMGITNTELQGLFVGQSYETVAQSLQNQYDEIFGG